MKEELKTSVELAQVKVTNALWSSQAGRTP